MTDRGPGRPAVGPTIKLAIAPEQIAWLDAQGRPRAETIRDLIGRQMSEEKEGKTMYAVVTNHPEIPGEVVVRSTHRTAEAAEKAAAKLSRDYAKQGGYAPGLTVREV